jgi:hypothetical protein
MDVSMQLKTLRFFSKISGCSGLYPPIYDRNFEPSLWLANYVITYIERNVPQII